MAKRRARSAGSTSAPKSSSSGRRGGRTAAVEESTAERIHPNPQFARPGWISLDGPWQFALDPYAEWTLPRQVRWNATIQVPFAPETPASGVAHAGFFDACWYRRTFPRPDLAPDQRLILRFGAVDHAATVWVNGVVAVMHEGGYTPFHADITSLLTDAGGPESNQEIIVRAEDDPHDLTKPRGKQDWQEHPHSIWYPRTSGIWQPVWLEIVGPHWLERIHWTPNLERFEIELSAQLSHSRPPAGLQLAVELSVNDRTLASDTYTVVEGEARRSIAFSDPGIEDYRNELLWCPERPVLIRADLKLLDPGRSDEARLLDHVASYTAMRSTGVLGERFMLNGRPRQLRLVLDQGYWPESGLTPPSDAAARRDIELAREMGFNGIRAHQRIPDPRSLYWADLLGLLVWEEMPSPYRFTSRTVQQITSQWAEAIDRDKSHPCIIVWVPMNESWGVPDLPTNEAHRQMVRALYHLTKSLDQTRPVVGNDGWEMGVTDIVAIHDYDSSPERLRQRYADRHDPAKALAVERPGHRVLLLDEHAYHGQPIMLTEFGGIAMHEPGEREGSWGYSHADSAAELRRRFEAIMAAVHDLPALGGFCYTQFADTYQEANGLLRADRTPKIPLTTIARAVTGAD